MSNVCKVVSNNAKQIISKKCNVVNICAFISLGVEMSEEKICEQVKEANKI